MDGHGRAILAHVLEGVAKVVTRLINRLAQEPLQTIPGSQDLRQVLFCDYTPIAIESDSFLNLDAQVAGPRPAPLKRFQQFRMGGDPRAAADQLDRGALVDVDLPPL